MRNLNVQVPSAGWPPRGELQFANPCQRGVVANETSSKKKRSSMADPSLQAKRSNPERLSVA
jgi:hypothetical protein